MHHEMLPRRGMLFALGGAAFAQGPGDRRRGPGGGPMAIEQLKERLNLTEDQVAKLEPILEESRKKGAALREKFMSMERTQENMQAMRGERQKMQEDLNAKMAGILDEDQQKEWEKMQEEARERFRQGRGRSRPQQ